MIVSILTDLLRIFDIFLEIIVFKMLVRLSESSKICQDYYTSQLYNNSRLAIYYIWKQYVD